MRLLLTNDDGIDAPGLAALREAARPFGDLVVVAPSIGHSGCGHRVTTDEPLEVIEVGPGVFAVVGTPADCVRVALHELCPDPDWVLAGINAGGNLGADVWLSGTVAAVREATLHGRRGIALSHYRRRERDFDWTRAAQLARGVMRDLFAQKLDAGSFWNVNLPHPNEEEAEPKVVHCRLDPHPLPLSYRREGGRLHYDGDYQGRRREADADVAVCFGGAVAVTRIDLF